ncbi:MAG: acyl transferase domain-containing protein [Phenylobacterium sp.]|jgi:acyl transferase domain-containing protein/NAD(P)-dependent dehydrogenase (short-subunit alcohol dehydrogenase family)/acyl carrier protein
MNNNSYNNNTDTSSDTDINVDSNDIAIIGMSCRYPGGANSAQQFFDFLLKGGDGIVDVPADRWDSNAYYDSDKNKSNRMYVKRGGFIDGIDQFDPQFFGISPKEAPYIDPQHRWLLELTQEVLENAGLIAGELKGSDTAVYIGQFMHDYEQILLDSAAHGMITSHSATGPSMTLTANRISYCFDFTGPSVTLDTACSSSLVALDMACKAILNGDSRVAVAGGVNILLRPELTMSICKASMLSPDTQCKSFDAAANGYVRSEGAGLLAVKKLSEAQKDGNNVLAVIKATSVNQDGHTSGITVPSGDAQQILLQKSLAKAGLRGSDIQYAEAHGTGTPVGDPIEVNALGKTLGARKSQQQRCIIGSVKSNIGHTEAAAGVAGIIKTVMAMNAGVIPGNIHYYNTNPGINLKALNISIASQNTPWPDTHGKTRKAVVNSFGFGGTNANIVLEQAQLRVGNDNVDAADTAAEADNGLAQLAISAKTADALKQQAEHYKSFLVDNKDTLKLADICYSATSSREQFKHRLVVNGLNHTDMAAAIDDFIAETPAPTYVHGPSTRSRKAPLAFVFSGMGTTWPQMGMALYAEQAVFKAMMDRCSQALQTYTGWSLLDAMAGTSADRIHQTQVAQPAIFSVQMSLVALLASRGVKPGCIVGHSAGEVAAAYCAGALSFDDAIKVIYHRSQLQHTTEGQGRMLAVALTEAALKPYLAGVEDKVSIGAINSEDAITLSGDADCLQSICDQLDDKGIFARFLKVAVPYHSPVMDQLKPALLETLKGLTVLPAHTPLYSTVSGKLTDTSDWDAQYWVDNVRDPVLFKVAIEKIQHDGFVDFIEIAPHAVLSSSIEANIKQKSNYSVTPTLKRGQNDNLMLANTLASLHCKGLKLDWSTAYNKPVKMVPLPTYCWQHETFWSEHEDVQAARLNNSQKRGAFGQSQHPLLGGKLISTSNLWQNNLDLEELSYLADHQVGEDIIYPGAAYVEMALTVAQQQQPESPSMCLENIEFKRAFFLSKENSETIETVLHPHSGQFQISALDQSGAPNQSKPQWSVFSEGFIANDNHFSASKALNISSLIAELPKQFDKTAFYQHCHSLGLNYLERFQMVSQCWFNDLDSLVKLNLDDSTIAELDDYILHPAILDGVFQSLFPTISSSFLPVKIDRLEYFSKPGNQCYGYLQTIFRNEHDLKGNLAICNEQGEILIQMSGVELKANNTGQSTDHSELDVVYNYQWNKTEQAVVVDSDAVESVENAPGEWLVLADSQGLAPRLKSVLEVKNQSVIYLEYSDAALDLLEKTLAIMGDNCKGIVYMWGLNNPDITLEPVDDIMAACRHTSITPLSVFQAVNNVSWKNSQRLVVVSQSAHQLETEQTLPRPDQAALWGFTRVLASEHPEYKVSLVDLSASVAGAEVLSLADEILGDEFEQEIALRQQQRFVNRLTRCEQTTLAQHSHHITQVSEGFVLSMDKKLQLLVADTNSVALADNDIRVKVERANVNLSQLQNSSMNSTLHQYTGTVIECGKTVSTLTTGDRIVTISLAAPASTITVNAAMAVSVDGSEQIDLAASVSSQYILTQLAALNAEQNVYIHGAHGADGNQGQALAIGAVDLGLNVYLSSSNPDDYQGLGLKQVCELAAFDQMVAQQSFDLVVNFAADSSAIRAAGRLKSCASFVDLAGESEGANDSDARLLMALAQQNSTYYKFSLAQLLTHSPQQVADTLLGIPANKRFAVPAGKVFDLEQLQAATDYLKADEQQDNITLDFNASSTNNAVSALKAVDPQTIGPNKSYLVTGGLGGLGLEIMNWLAQGGAQSVVLIGRSKPNATAMAAIDKVKAIGVRVECLQADVTKADEVKKVISHIENSGYPLGGIVHSAGVLDDATISQQSVEKFNRVLAPKILGSWNLHQQSLHLELDFFVCFSSIAAVVGWAGQSNYAAANAFMDGLCHYRCATGKAGLSINWGPWAEAGMAANLASEDIKRMNNAGMAALKPEQGFAAMSRLMTSAIPQAGVFDLDWSKIFNQLPSPDKATVFSGFFAQNDNVVNDNFLEQFKQSEGEDKKQLLTDKVIQYLADVLGLDSAENIEANANVFEYGLNSLMGMDLKNRLQGTLEIQLPGTLVLKNPNVAAITDHILGMFADNCEEKTAQVDIAVVKDDQKIKVSI